MLQTTETPAAIMDRLTRLAASPCTAIVLHSDPDTDVERVARAIHAASPRREYPFIACNATGRSDVVIDQQLFGWAGDSGPSLCHSAHRGTLFIREIADLPLAAQSKLCHTLDEGSYRQFEAPDKTPVDFRLIAATTRHPLEKGVKAGQCYPTLYYSVSHITLPAAQEWSAEMLAFIHSTPPTPQEVQCQLCGL